MISPLKIVERVGTGGRLVPFFKLVAVYFLMAGDQTPSLMAVICKCAPVLSLALFVFLYHGTTFDKRGWYARRIFCGLMMSCVGDALLVWPQQLMSGMAAFACALAFYIAALGWQPGCYWLGAPLYATAVKATSMLSLPPALHAAVPLYALLLSTVAWRALARLQTTMNMARLAAALGALAFLVSDTILGFNLFHAPIKNDRLLVMSTYYLAQLGFALSILDQELVVETSDRQHAP